VGGVNTVDLSRLFQFPLSVGLPFIGSSVAERSLFPFFNVFEALIQPLTKSFLNRR